LPETVLVQLREAMIAVPEVGLSVLGISHRSDWFAAVVAEVEVRLKALLALRGFHVLLLQGGASATGRAGGPNFRGGGLPGESRASLAADSSRKCL